MKPETRNANLHTAISAALEAGKVILDIYNSVDFEVELKDDNSPLTKADTAAHHVIMAHLSTTDIPVLSEEGKSIAYHTRKDWKHLWIVDPIDGTKEFIKRNGEFTVNIALIKNQKPVLGVIFVPVTGDLYFSCSCLSGRQASSCPSLPGEVIHAGGRRATSTSPDSYRDSTSTSGSYKVKVDLINFDIESLITKAERLPLPRTNNRFTILASRSHPSEASESYIHKLKQKHGEVELVAKGSSLKFCLIAEGQADCYPKFGPTMEWDTAAGQAICEQAGVEVLDWNSKEDLLYNREDLLNPWFIVQKQMLF
ncbi:3'(2'),5'-bisphosphate nucleotidase CysQ [Gelidibacter sp. F63206]|uniref:3'(2'),5'-bisphosphate nucleotidase CysQ family protein n=1 Tax=Gelidibacter sp. F63206 TaxID=2926425 RepID=UPI001FF5D0B0|nr:3'(2'),5'-bisphosphate nucleotidase CysQ [Gelidibacter sp. F63206]MCK0115063.1 3'(2'),5'-bisphosphate nucleotidase CysQ [Gelidibacter sp. F63206]